MAIFNSYVKLPEGISVLFLGGRCIQPTQQKLGRLACRQVVLNADPQLQALWILRS